MTPKEAIEYLNIMKLSTEDDSVGGLKKEVCDIAIEALSVVEQIRWERDIALHQLEEIGLGFGEMADVQKVVRCKDCVHRNDEEKCPMLFGKWEDYNDDGYIESDWVVTENTEDEGFCHKGKRFEE